jgi:hypothetical protein
MGLTPAQAKKSGTENNNSADLNSVDVFSMNRIGSPLILLSKYATKILRMKLELAIDF